jgi:hypothetical protein
MTRPLSVDPDEVDPFCQTCPATIAARVGDAIRGRHRANESVVSLAKDYRLSRKEVRLILAHPHRSAA